MVNEFIGLLPKPPDPYRYDFPGDDPQDPLRLAGQQDKQELRVGAEYVLIAGRLKVPLRAGYFNDRQITPNPGGDTPRFNGYTLGTGLLLGPLLLDVAYVHESGGYSVAADSPEFDVQPGVTIPIGAGTEIIAGEG